MTCLAPRDWVPTVRSMRARETSFVVPQELVLVEELTRAMFLSRQHSDAAESSPAMGRMVVRESHEFKVFLQETAEAFDGEHRGLIRGRCSSDIHTDEQRS